MPKRYVASLFFLLLGLISIHFLKNETREMEVKIEKLSKNIFLNAINFFRTDEETNYNLYHHIGIYAFTNKALMRYVGLERSKLELERKLEQLRALENNMSIHVGYTSESPLSVDTEKDLIEIKKKMENKK